VQYALQIAIAVTVAATWHRAAFKDEARGLTKPNAGAIALGVIVAAFSLVGVCAFGSMLLFHTYLLCYRRMGTYDYLLFREGYVDDLAGPALPPTPPPVPASAREAEMVPTAVLRPAAEGPTDGESGAGALPAPPRPAAAAAVAITSSLIKEESIAPAESVGGADDFAVSIVPLSLPAADHRLSPPLDTATEEGRRWLGLIDDELPTTVSTSTLTSPST
jgi:hypothetical protein